MRIVLENAQKTHVMKRAWPKYISLLLFLLFFLSACSVSTGIFSGGTWQLSGLQKQHIHALAVDPNNPQNIYAGDAQNGVFASNDGGLHWAQHNTGLPLPIQVNALSFDFSGKGLYAATSVGIFVSMDGTQHWLNVSKTGKGLPVSENYTALALSYKAPQLIFVATQHHGVFLSRDVGKTWSNASDGLPADSIINNLTLDSLQHQLWAATNRGVYRTDDQKGPWQSLSNGLPSSALIFYVLPASISGGKQGQVFAGTNHGFFLSQDSGMHWTASAENLSGTSIYSILLDFRQSDLTTLYIATNVGVFRSDDSGQNWGGIASGLPRKNVYALAIGSTNYVQLYAALDDVYLFPGTSGGLSFNRLLPVALILLFFYFLYRITTLRRNRSREVLKPERISEPPGE